MPRPPTATEIRLENLADCLAPTIEVLNELNETFSSPFVQPISNTVASLLKLVQVFRLSKECLVTDQICQSVKQNKKECAQLLDNVYQVLYALIVLYMKAEATGSLSPEMTDHVGKFMKYVHQVYPMDLHSKIPLQNSS